MMEWLLIAFIILIVLLMKGGASKDTEDD